MKLTLFSLQFSCTKTKQERVMEELCVSYQKNVAFQFVHYHERNKINEIYMLISLNQKISIM